MIELKPSEFNYKEEGHYIIVVLYFASKKKLVLYTNKSTRRFLFLNYYNNRFNFDKHMNFINNVTQMLSNEYTKKTNRGNMNKFI